MAILDAVPGLEVSICIDGKPLEEYEDDEEEVKPGPQSAIAEYQGARTVSKYVESVSDKEFTIDVNLGTSFVMDCDSLSAPIKIDGNLMISPLFLKNRLGVYMRGDRMISKYSRSVDGVMVAAPGITDRNFIKRFKFAKIETTTDDSKLGDLNKDMKFIDKVGEITIKFYRCGEATDTTKDATAHDVNTKIASQIHEKALKGQAKSHTTSLGPATTLVKKDYARVEKLDGKDYPLAIFKFKYRSRDALKSLLIIERTPSPDLANVDSDLDLDNLSAAQKAKLKQLLRGLFDGGNSARSTPNRTIKREREEGRDGEASRKKRKSGPVMTIDLTEDSDEENILL